jgi:hypothetical protein
METIRMVSQCRPWHWWLKISTSSVGVIQQTSIISIMMTLLFKITDLIVW